MAKALPAIDYLAAPKEHPPALLNVVFGDEAFLKRQVLLALKTETLGKSDSDFAYSTFDGDQAQLGDVLDELGTIAMFGGETRLVRVDQADKFVSKNRDDLEKYAENPIPTGRLILDLKSFPANTRLYKAVAKTGLIVACTTPTEAELPKWLCGWTSRSHGIQLEMAAARLLTEMVGPELGLLDQEVGKLALLLAEGQKITAKLVRDTVGNWRTRTAWDMLDSALAGNLRDALNQLDRLLLAGEQPVAIMGQISATLRKFAAATRIIISSEQERQSVSLRNALERAGFPRFKLRDIEKQLRHLGRERGRRLYQALVETDLALKGNSALPPRLVIENMLIRLSQPASAHAAGK